VIIVITYLQAPARLQRQTGYTVPQIFQQNNFLQNFFRVVESEAK